MRVLGVSIVMVLLVGASHADPQVVRLWEGVAPGSEAATGEEIWKERGEGIVDRSVAGVHEPTLTIYRPVEEINTGTAVVICPGGGYRHLAIDKEGHDVAKWLAAAGITGAVLKYRLPKTEGAGYTLDTALADAERAIRMMRHRARDLAIDPERIGVMGFSAGGHLAVRAGVHYDSGDGASTDPIERMSSRPAFLVPVYTGLPDDLKVDEQTPPAFLVHAHDDRVPSTNSTTVYEALREAGVAAELHIYSEGGHGFGIRNRGIPASSWTRRFLDWLTVQGFLKQ
jgi:endo-1,4-beta-xylanase